MSDSSLPLYPPTLPRQRVRPVQERSRRKIDAILDATADILTTQGVEAVTMLAIAERAGLPTATVYHYFENRLAVLAALAERTMLAVDTELERRMAELVDLTDFRSRRLLQLLYLAYREAPGYVPILRALRAEPVFDGLVRESNQRGANIILLMLGSQAALEPVRAQRIAWMLSEFCEQILQSALMADEQEAAALMEELAEMMDALFLHYCTPRV